MQTWKELDLNDENKVIQSITAISGYMMQLGIEKPYSECKERIELENKILKKFPLLEFVEAKYHYKIDDLINGLKTYIK